MSDDETQTPRASGSGDPLTRVLTAITSSQAELGELRDEMRGVQEDTAAKLASVKSERPYQFRKKGHEEQHAFNASVQGRLVEAGLQLNRAERGVAEGAARTSLENAKRALQEGKDLITQRQKLIKVTDRSELGWAVVAEYQADEQADNLDDERKLERAAERRMAGKKWKMDAGNCSSRREKIHWPHHWALWCRLPKSR